MNPNQNLNTVRTPAGFREMLNSLGPGGRAATENFLSLALMSGGRVDVNSIGAYKTSYPLIANSVFSRIADGSSGLSIPPQAGASWASGSAYVGTPQTVAPQTVAPQTVAPQTVAPQTVAPQTVEPTQGDGLIGVGLLALLVKFAFF